MSFFPDVPPLPGVPILLRDPVAAPYVPPQLLFEDGTGFQSALPPAQWGIYSRASGNPSPTPLVVSDTVIAFAYRQDWALLNYPVEEGGFQSYNKVNSPYEVKLTYVIGGTEDDRAAMLNSIAQISDTIELVDVYTPEATYSRMNVTHYDYERRSTNGVGLLKVDVWLVEIRQPDEEAGAELGQNTQAPASASDQSIGTVQPQDSTLSDRESYDDILKEFGFESKTSDELYEEARQSGLF